MKNTDYIKHWRKKYQSSSTHTVLIEDDKNWHYQIIISLINSFNLFVLTVCKAYI